MGSLSFSKEKVAPADLLSRPQSGGEKYLDLLRFIETEATVGEWIKVGISEDDPEQLKKSIHSMQNTVRTWRKRLLKSGRALVELSQYRKVISSKEAEVWIRIDKYEKKRIDQL